MRDGSRSADTSSPLPVGARSKAWVCDRPIVGIVGSNPAEEHKSLSVVSDVRCAGTAVALELFTIL
jgi:hypothetical protein